MTIRVLYFAVLRERLGRSEELCELPEGTSVGALFDRLAAANPTVAALRGRLQVAVNREVVPPGVCLTDGDEVALIPPVAGGVDLGRVRLVASPLSLDAAVREVQGPEQGGIVTFTGYVRRQGAVENVVRLEYEAYEPMAIEVLAAIAREIELEYPGTRVAIHHRLGHLAVGELAVVIATSAPHRAEAFGACRVAIERLKQRVPIWKKEIGEAGDVWVGTGP